MNRNGEKIFEQLKSFVIQEKKGKVEKLINLKTV